jgi:hypothetical protein
LWLLFWIRISEFMVYRKTREVHDVKKRIMAIFVGRPQDSEWKKVTDNATALMQEVEKLGHKIGAFDDKYLHHRRGDFVALPVGVSYGGGATVGFFPLSCS